MENLLKSCFDESRHVIVIFDKEGTIAYKNTSFDVFFPGVSKDKSLFEIFKHNPLVVERILKVTQDEGSYSLWDFPVEVADHSIKTMDIECYPVTMQKNDTPLYGLIFYNRSGSAQVGEHQKRLDRIQYLATITMGLAHEIRNPLSGIKGAAQLLMDSLKDCDELKGYAEIIQNETIRVDRLIKDLQCLTQSKKLSKKPVNVNKVVHDIVFLQKTIHPEKIIFHEEYDPSLPAIAADFEALSQVVLNLIKNARQAIAKKGTVMVKTRIVNDFLMHKSGKKQLYVAIDINDTGTGIPPETLKNIFIPFFTTKKSGTGLGLALCQQIVEEHGGQLLVKSEEEKGSTFSVLLPV
ncbi:MAG: hypothetical protein ACD_73C00098G0003 [uncultured bacterium]|nr:MAG: hypothetical protein ACD_73C00098G0003 [uncultured bacterium]